MQDRKSLGWQLICVGVAVLGLLSCTATRQKKSYTILASSPIEALPFMLPSEQNGQHFQWQVIIDSEGTLEQRLALHEPDFYMVDFFTHYLSYQEEGEFLRHQAILASYSDFSLIVRKAVVNAAAHTWRLGMSYGSMSDYLLDYWFETTKLNRIQVRDDEQGMVLLQQGVLDGMVLPRQQADLLLADGNVVVVKNSLIDGALRLTLMVDNHYELAGDERNKHIIQDYRIGMLHYQEMPELLEQLPLTVKEQQAIIANQTEALGLEPFMQPTLYEQLLRWRLIHVPFSVNWAYESLFWTPKPVVTDE